MERRGVRQLGVVVLLAAILLVPWLGSRDLWSPDEPRYAAAARSITHDGLWLSPEVHGEPYADKPPAYFWWVALLSRPFGDVGPWTARLPSVLFALATLAMVFDLGRRIARPSVGVAAACVLLTTWLFAWLARRVNLDVAMTACATATVWAAVRAGLAERGGRRAAWGALAGVAAVLGLATKGPVAWLVPGCALLGALSHPRSRRFLAGLATALPAFAATTAASLAGWLGPAIALEGYAPLTIVREHVLARALHGMHHVQPPWYYLEVGPALFLPWTFLAVPALASIARRALPTRRTLAGARADAIDATLAAATLAPLLLLTLSVEKSGQYLLPVAPAIALAIARWIAGDPGTEDSRSRRAALGVTGVAVGALAIAGATLGLAGARFEATRSAFELPGAGAAGVALAACSIVGAGIACRAALSRRGTAALVGIAFGVATLQLGVFTLEARLDPVKSARPLAASLERVTAGARLAIYPQRRDEVLFYLAREAEIIREPGRLAAWLETATADGTAAFVACFRRFEDDLPALERRTRSVVLREPVGHREWVVVRYGVDSASLDPQGL